jgi:hypothetical protein
MNPQALNNGSHRERARELDPEAPKTKTDEKIARHIKSIIFAVLAVLGLGVLTPSGYFTIVGGRSFLT